MIVFTEFKVIMLQQGDEGWHSESPASATVIGCGDNGIEASYCGLQLTRLCFEFL